MDFTKFMSLIEDESLFFSNLTDHSDKMEGFLTKASVDRFRTFPEDITGYERYRKKQIRENNLKALKNSREYLYISCWHMSEYESAAMWELYLKDYQGIAIQTTICNFMESLKNTKENVYIGKINYLDREKEEFPWNNVFFLALNKGNSYEHEKEIRGVILGNVYKAGISVYVDLSKLIESIYLAPHTPQWIHELIKKIVRKYKLEVDVKPSVLGQEPLY